MAKSLPQTDVLVLGDHPCAYLAATLLRQGTPLRVIHCAIPGETYPDRLTLLNPAFFDLHPLLGGMKRKLDLTPIYGLRFLADAPTVFSEHAASSIGAYIVSLRQVRAAMEKLAAAEQVPMSSSTTLEIHGLDETGVDVTIGKTRCRPRLILLAGPLPAEQRRILGLPEGWDGDVVHRYTYLKVKAGKLAATESRRLMPMSLDLKSTLAWGWFLPGTASVQFAVEEPLALAQSVPPKQMLRHWMDVLAGHGILKTTGAGMNVDAAVSLDLPLAGALAQDGVANRTLLFGPAGGFYSACAEDLYPCCWSAVFAAEAARKSLREPFLQDALQQHRQRWGATLGDYLRGPQQNLRFLLPLVYRNRTMAARLAEAILSGKSVVR